MSHEEFAERLAVQLEARANALEDRTDRTGASEDAGSLRTAAELAREAAAAVTQEEAPPVEAQA